MFVWTQHNKLQLSEPTVLIKALKKVLKNLLSNAPVDKNKKIIILQQRNNNTLQNL